MTPSALKGKELETLLLDAAKRLETAGILTMSRYGVHGMVVAGKNGGASQTLLIPSLPDFEGCLANGRQFIIEAKVCSGPSFPMQKSSLKPRQVAHMLTRSRFGVPCFLVIHFNERILKNAIYPGITVAVPVNDSSPIWQRYLDVHDEAKRTGNPPKSQAALGRDAAQDMGPLIPWRVGKGCRKALPDLAGLLLTLPGVCQTGNAAASTDSPTRWIAPVEAAQPEPTLFD